MSRRVGSAVAVVCTVLVPFIAEAQVAQPAAWQGSSRPQGAPLYAQRAYPPPSAQRPYPQVRYHSGYGATTYSSSSAPVPASYAYAGNHGYANGYPASYYGPTYAQGNQVGSTTRAEAPGTRVQTKDHLHYIEIGMGAFIPTDSGNPAKLGLEASL
jgi:hypothetical protein